MSEVKSFYESIIVLDNIKENNPRYVEFTANNSGNPFIMESSVPNNEENQDICGAYISGLVVLTADRTLAGRPSNSILINSVGIKMKTKVNL